MRIFSSARIAVIDADSAHRTAFCAALKELGMERILPASTIEEAREFDRQAPLDLCVVHAAEVPANGRNGGYPRNPFDPARTPGILLAANAGRDAARLAHALGYRVALPTPAVPRLVYRRMGSILQKVRRSRRVNAPELAPLAAPPAAELQQS